MSTSPVQRIAGWGRVPSVMAQVHQDNRVNLWRQRLLFAQQGLLARGNGRSYGDSSLHTEVIDTTATNRLISFDRQLGVLSCDAGVLLRDLLNVVVPSGWFLPVTPGTSWITVGGAVASDVHGKNHHQAGSFCDHVKSIQLLLASGEILQVSRVEHPDLFRATCAGMGLTGVIVAVCLKLMPIQSSGIVQKVFKTRDLQETLERFESSSTHPYSVAWIDCVKQGPTLGRSVLFVGEHAPANNDHDLQKFRSPPTKNWPFEVPGFLLHRHSVSAFNHFYYSKARHGHTQILSLMPFFYPLDAIGHWNRLYGPNGFFQYQLVLPKAAGQQALQGIVEQIARAGTGSFLAVLKLLGPGNDNFLSFPTEGYTLALDFQWNQRNLALAKQLDAKVQEAGGRLYLSKDARMSESMFKTTYPQWERFQEVRQQYGALGVFKSQQSVRLGLA